MVQICPKCDFDNIDQTYYCSKCGAKIREFSTESGIGTKSELPPNYDERNEKRYKRTILFSIDDDPGWRLFWAIGSIITIIAIIVSIVYAVSIFLKNQYPSQEDYSSIGFLILLGITGIVILIVYPVIVERGRKKG